MAFYLSLPELCKDGVQGRTSPEVSLTVRTKRSIACSGSLTCTVNVALAHYLTQHLSASAARAKRKPGSVSAGLTLLQGPRLEWVGREGVNPTPMLSANS
jgi:hypothetical protein